ncbi:MAG TPA: thiosulfate oxidation carrier protein SoxY [Thiobacillaceae bacterium]|nr:thiosulfate oxidation carrier protein SoxY [Thiobacillaceae bacterium]
MNELNTQRRTLLKGGCAAGAVMLAASAGLLAPRRVLAAEWNKTAFEAKSVGDALKGLGASGVADSADIEIKAPDIAENGSMVPIEVTSRIAGTQSIAILSEKNPLPLLAAFDFSDGAEGYVSTRVKMGQTSMVRVVVTAGGKHYATAREIKVTIGGCGG